MNLLFLSNWKIYGLILKLFEKLLPIRITIKSKIKFINTEEFIKISHFKIKKKHGLRKDSSGI
jgi:hypothetical protein